jgi:hypothetical protein
MTRLINKSVIGICVFFMFSCNRPTVEDLTVAVAEKNYEKAKDLLQRGVSTDALAMEDKPLVIAAAHNDIEMIVLLVNYGADPNVICQDESLLQWAIRKKEKVLIKILIDKGADVNYISPDGSSVFSSAMSSLSDDELNIFIENGLDLMGRSKGNKNQISYFEGLLFYNKLETAKLLLRNDAVLSEVISDSYMSIKLVDYWDTGVKDLADFLVTKGLRLNYDLPLLQHAINNYEATEWLLDHGVSPIKEYLAPGAMDFEKTPLDAAYFGLYMVTTYAKEDGAYVENSPDELERRRVIELLEKRIAEMSAVPAD